MSANRPTPARVGILGTGSFLPERTVGNEEMAAATGVTPEWIERKTGILERRYARGDQATSDLAAEAGRRALENAGVHPAELSLIIVATSTPDRPQPPTAAVVQHLLGADRAAAFDVNAVCAGFVVALRAGVCMASLGDGGTGGRTLVIGGDVYSRVVDPADRRTAPLFGDGAGAVVLGPVTGAGGFLGTRVATDSTLLDLIRVDAGGSRQPATPGPLARGDHYFRMRGREVRDYVTRELPRAVHGLLAELSVPPEDIRHFVPHQANGAMLKDLWTHLGLPRAHLHLPVTRHGNTGAASIPLALDHAHRSGRLAAGDLVLLAGFGGGMTMGTSLISWGGHRSAPHPAGTTTPTTKD
ncbi:ketoacyl-ACP synthase III [Streptomyces sp. NPDC023723]|uniref:3-oxoacyl-ACP synthase III family protein n=1 Tax=Streptomyces sp. NPDC023723 TaxID=3154323 RepID=UPI00340BE35C